MKTLVIALGGNALIKEGQKGTAEEQLENLKTPLSQIVKLYGKYRILITHGNGPQVGNILLQQESTPEVPSLPLEFCVAQSQGLIGYMIEVTLDNEFMRAGIEHPLLVTVLTYTKVDKNDPAFKNPTKPIGPYYTEEEAKKLPYKMVKTPRGYRRVVASPKPQYIVETREIKSLLDLGAIVVACGGGGIPVIKEHKTFEGVEAVIDKDLATARLASDIEADILLILTNVDKVYLNYGKDDQMGIDRMTLEEAKKYLREGQFPEGSMGPKIEASINFLESGGEKAIIAHINDLLKALDGKAGTQIVP